jgi:hypothetical protein
MEKSAEIGKLAEALAKAQGVMQNAKKDSENPFFKSKYADLGCIIDAVRKPFADNGLSFSQLVEESNDDTAVVTTLLLHTSGEWLSSKLKLKPTKTDPQGIGSAITYARRYALSAIAGIASEDDDDGNKASEPAPTKESYAIVDGAMDEIPRAETLAQLEKIHGTFLAKFNKKEIVQSQWDTIKTCLTTRKNKISKESK